MIVGSRFSRHKGVKAVRPLYFRCSFLSDYLYCPHNESFVFGYFRYHPFGHSCICMGEIILKLAINCFGQFITFFKGLVKIVLKRRRSEAPSQFSSGNVQMDVMNGELYGIDLSINKNRKEVSYSCCSFLSNFSASPILPDKSLLGVSHCKLDLRIN